MADETLVAEEESIHTGSEKGFSEPESPFGSQGPDIQTITLMRIYDVLMGLYRESNPSAAKDLLELHLEGIILTPAPAFIGQFITNDMNATDESVDMNDDEEVEPVTE